MGCDIHAFVETKRDGKWRLCGGPVITTGRPLDDIDHVTWVPFRSYADFSLLAGVRQADPDIVPISEPRGLPEDISDELREIVEGEVDESVIYKRLGLVDPPNCYANCGAWGDLYLAAEVIYGNTLDIGEHSFSWVTAEELRTALALRPSDTHGQLRWLLVKMSSFGLDTRLVFGFDS